MAKHTEAMDEAMDRDIDPRPVRGALLFVAAMFVSIAVAALFGWIYLFRDNAVRSAQREPPMPPLPHLQAAPRSDLAALRAAEDGRLRHYGWIDRTAGIAHVPIERAMALLVQSQSAQTQGQRNDGASNGAAPQAAPQ
jgi:hypothetical protein